MSQVVVIGGGVIGLSSPYYSALRGFSVTVVDRSPQQDDGCSYGNAGMIVPSHFIPLAAPGAVALGLKWMWNPESPFWIRPRLDKDLFGWGIKFWRAANADHVRRTAPLLRDLHLGSREAFEELAGTDANSFGLVRRGLIALCQSEHVLEEEAQVASKARELGIPAEVLNARDLAKLEPSVQMNAVGAIYFPKDCHLPPHRLMQHLRKLAQQAGVQFIFDTEVQGVRRDENRIRAVETSGGEITADQFVLAGGSWSPILAKTLGLNLPMQAGKGYSLTLENPPKLPNICAILTEARVAVTPMGSSLRVGGTMEMAGLNENINHTRAAGIVKAATRYYPEFRKEDFANIKPWCGLRPVSPDGLPYLGRTKRFSNLVVATGHAMMGLSLGPVTGKLVAETLSRDNPSINIQALDPDRYA